VYLGRCPFSSRGVIVHDYGFSNGVAIVRVEQGDKVGYGFIECTDFNMEYWRGHVEVGRYELRVRLYSKFTAVAAQSREAQDSPTLSLAFPNPFNQATEFHYSSLGDDRTEIAIFDVTGRLVTTLVAQRLPVGRYRVVWDGRDQQGLPVPSGMYWCRLRNGSLVRRQRITLVR
jgi:hypothetical protein